MADSKRKDLLRLLQCADKRIISFAHFFYFEIVSVPAALAGHRGMMGRN